MVPKPPSHAAAGSTPPVSTVVPDKALAEQPTTKTAAAAASASSSSAAEPPEFRRRDLLFLALAAAIPPAAYFIAANSSSSSSHGHAADHNHRHSHHHGISVEDDDDGANRSTPATTAAAAAALVWRAFGSSPSAWPLTPLDLVLGLIVAVVLCAVRLALRRPFMALGRSYVLSAKKRADSSRLARFASVFFKLLFFIAITAAGLIILHDEPFFPAALGGGRAASPANAFPPPRPPPRLLLLLLRLGYHAHSLLYMVTLEPERRLDFGEMLLHHLVTVALISLSYLGGQMRIGCLILFLHDASDISSYMIKSVVDTGRTLLTLSVYLFLLASWGYCRLYVFPFLIIATIMRTDVPFVDTTVRYVFVGLLLCLQALHLYWYSLFLDMGMEYLKSGKTEDTHDTKKQK
ncbi:TLC domain-containing protein [Zopfochytrium polystomum]|nr:TLC domain-containing protein [Zopfochytrium polystomum]